MSALVVCLICDRQRNVFDPYGYNICSNCGSKDPDIRRARRAWDNWEDVDGVDKNEACRRTYAGLKWLRDSKSYKPKWADARYRSIFGCWPPREIEDVPPEPPTQGLMRRVRLDNQNWKKRKREEEKANPTVIAIIPHDPVLPSFMTEDDWTVKL